METLSEKQPGGVGDDGVGDGDCVSDWVGFVMYLTGDGEQEGFWCCDDGFASC